MLWLVMFSPFLFQPFGDGKICKIDPWKDLDNWQPIPSLMETKCASNPQAIQDIMGSWDTGLDCWANSQPPGWYNNITWCTDYAEEGYGCVEKLMNAFEPYTDSEEKYIKDFMLNSHNKTMERLCKDGEDSFKDMVKNAGKRSCKDDTGQMAYDALMKCLPKMKLIQEMTNVDAAMNKSDFCSNFRSTTTCIIDYLEEECTNRDFSSLLKTIFDSHLDWCNKNA